MNYYDDDEDLLKEKQAKDRAYLQIYEGMLCIKRSEQPEDPAFKRYESKSNNTKGKVSWIKEFECVKGYLTSFRKREHEDKKENKKYFTAEITFEKLNGKQAIVSTPLKGELVARLAKCAENINFAMPLELSAFRDGKTGRTRIILKQDGKNVEQKYTQENPGKMPKWVKDDMSGEWDNKDYWLFLFSIIKDVVIPGCENTKAGLERHRQMEREHNPIDEAPDDLSEPEDLEETNEADEIPF